MPRMPEAQRERGSLLRAQGRGPVLPDLVDARHIGLFHAGGIAASVADRLAPPRLLLAEGVADLAGLAIDPARFTFHRPGQPHQFVVQRRQFRIGTDLFFDSRVRPLAVEAGGLGKAWSSQAASDHGETDETQHVPTLRATIERR